MRELLRTTVSLTIYTGKLSTQPSTFTTLQHPGNLTFFYTDTHSGSSAIMMMLYVCFGFGLLFGTVHDWHETVEIYHQTKPTSAPAAGSAGSVRLAIWSPEGYS